ncbi:MAG: hypothetical protein Q8N63_05470 [Nanoarchaeota archaeon]|nr:hypothetical protein [Nanoarchaeota archaeon]
MHFDEKYVRVNGDDNFDLNAVDSVTKFVLAHSFVVVRTKKACIKFLSQIKTNCYNQILSKYYIRKYSKGKKKRLIIFICDKFANYKTAFNKLFYRVAELQFGVPIACKKYHLEHNNNAVERYNGKTKDRIKNIRGGFGSFDGAKYFMDLRRVIHNFVNPHQELNEKTPAEIAEIKLNLGRNKLLGLIMYLANEGNDD